MGLGSFFQLLGVMWHRADDLTRVLNALPNVLCVTGNGMKQAATGATGASQLLKGGGPIPANTSASAVTQHASDAMDLCADAVSDAKDALATARTSLNSIKIPKPSFAGSFSWTIGVGPGAQTYQVPYGLAIDSNWAPFSTVATQLSTVETHLATLEQKLSAASTAVESLAAKLEQSGTNFASLGGDLRDAGDALIDLACPQQP